MGDVSVSQNKVRVDLHAYDADIVMIQDYDAKETTLVYPSNTTFPNGVCEVPPPPPAGHTGIIGSLGAHASAYLLIRIPFLRLYQCPDGCQNRTTTGIAAAMTQTYYISLE